MTKKMVKRFLSLLLTVCMILTMIPVTAYASQSYMAADDWTVLNPDSNAEFNSPTSVTITTQYGNFDKNMFTTKNVFLHDVENKDFEISVTLDFKPTANYQTAGLMVYKSNEEVFGFVRRYHTWFDTKSLCTMGVDGSYSTNLEETHEPDPSSAQERLYLKITRTGTTLQCWYSLDNETWTQHSSDFTYESFDDAAELKVGFYTGDTSSAGTAEATFSDFTLKVGDGEAEVLTIGKPREVEIFSDMEARVYEDEESSMPYRLYVPKDYDASKTYPVLVFLHGASERGNDNKAQLIDAIQTLFDVQPQMKNAIVIAPQCPSGKRWVETDWDKGNYDSDAIEEVQLKTVMNILAEVQSEYSTDTDRIYAMGVSMGGFGTWDLLTRHNDVFAAGIPICGSGDISKADILKNIPIWTFHGTADAVVPYSGTVNTVNAIEAAGGENITFTTYENAPHAIWNTVATEEGLIDWLFAQKLSDRPVVEDTELVNLFDKDSDDNWLQALTYNGTKLENATSYENLFATHKIEVAAGDKLSWGGFGKEFYVMEIYDANDNFLKQVTTAETTATALGDTVAGVGGTIIDNYRYSYTITTENAAYVRILGNISTMDTFQVYKNLEDESLAWPEVEEPEVPDVETRENLFDKDSDDIWLNALTLDGQYYPSASTYANIFTTHKIEVANGDTLEWGTFGKEGYVMEIYDANNAFVRRVSFGETTSTSEGFTVTGVGGSTVTAYSYKYTIIDSNAAYVRILGNISTMDDYYVYKTAGEEVEVIESVLNDKTVLFTGDSITDAVKDEKGLEGWAGRIGNNYGMTWTNVGLSGASVSTVRGSNRVIAQLTANSAKDYDYLILHGGVNDAMDSEDVGTISDSYKLSDFDSSTFAGGLEELIYTAMKNYEGSRIGYIVNYATPNSTWGGRTKDMSEYFTVAKEICDKWGIPYIDLYEGTVTVDGEELSYSYDILEVDTAVCMYAQDAGEVHIGGEGYDRISPYIAAWMETLPVTESKIQIEESVLTGKSILFTGDSITFAGADEKGRNGWAGRIGEDNGMDWKNAGVSGASISIVRPTNRVLSQLNRNKETFYDYVILHGGVNDAWDSASVGTMSDSFDLADFDVTTYAGGLEELFHFVCTHYEGSRVGYIINYATPNSTCGGRTRDMSEYFEVCKQICDKWGIPYIDLYSGTVTVDGVELSYSYDILEMDTAVSLQNNNAGEVHIGGEGYDRISPYIAEWIKTLEVTEKNVDTSDSIALYTGTGLTVTDGVLDGVVRRNTVSDIIEQMADVNGELVFTDAEGNVLGSNDKVTEGTIIQLVVDGQVTDEIVVGVVEGADVSAYPENVGNLALDKKTWATSEYNTAGSGGGTANNATDGITSNYWDGGTVKNEPTLTVDLGEVYQVGRINVVNYVTGSRYYHYEIYVSVDGETWTLAAEKTDNAPATSDGEDFVFEDKIEARYVRILGTYNCDNEAFHVKELRVYESSDPIDAGENIIPVSEMTATTGDYQTGNEAEKAIDENESTMWHTSWTVGPNHDNHWLQLNLNDVYTVEGFKYQPRQSGSNGWITGYEIWTSLDGENWTTVASGAWPADAAWKKAVFEPVEAKYVRLVTTEGVDTGSTKFASAAEVRVLGTLYEEPPVVEEVYAEIITQPTNVVAAKGENAVVTFEAIGDGLTYTWYYKNPGSVKFYKSGAGFVDGNTYSIPMYAWRDGQQVYCLIEDAYGNMVTTNTVTISMKKTDIEIVKQPVDVTVAKGADATVSVEAVGEGLTYTWYYKNPGNVKFYESGEQFVDGATYSIPMYQWRNGQQVYCVITNANGESVQTNTVILTMAE